MAGVGAFTSVRLGIQITRYHVRSNVLSQPLWQRLVRSLFTVVGGLVLYGYVFAVSVELLVHPTYLPGVSALALLVLVCCGLGLFRAWELLGAPRVGVLAGWLNPLQPTEEGIPAVPTAAVAERSTTPEVRAFSAQPVADNAQPRA
jgi:hypothetical protein